MKCVTEVAFINPLNAKLNPICQLLALLRAHHILHVSRIRVKKERYTRSQASVRTHSGWQKKCRLTKG